MLLAYLPLGQLRQADDEVPPVLGLYLPTGHFEHADRPLVAYRPFPQVEHDLDPILLLYFPELHALQADNDVPPALGLYLPVGQSVHTRPALYFPAPQLVLQPVAPV